MVSGKITNNGRINLLNRGYKTTPDYSVPYQFQIGIGTTEATISDTSLEIPVPISNGTVNDNGSNTLTGSSGGSNTTDNTTTYKQGGNVVDNTAQNLIKNDTDTTAIWSISDLSAEGNIITSTDYISLWLYIKDSDVLNKFVNSGTCLEIKLGSDNSNYYSITKETSDLSTGWNWITSYPNTVADLAETGTVSGDIDTFIIEITTNNTTDELVSGDVIYDLLRTYDENDLFKTFVTDYPSINESNLRTTIRTYLTSIEANGFLITEIGIFNNDSTPVLLTRDVIQPFSKSNTDEGAFIIKDTLGERE